MCLLRAMECFLVFDDDGNETKPTRILSRSTELMLDVTASLCDILVKQKQYNCSGDLESLNPINTLARLLSSEEDVAGMKDEEEGDYITAQIKFSVKTSRIISKCISNRLASYLIQRSDYNCKGNIHQASKLLEKSLEKTDERKSRNSKKQNTEHYTMLVGVVVAFGIGPIPNNGTVTNNNSIHQHITDVALRCAFLIRGSVDWNSAVAVVLCMMMTELSCTRILPQYWVSNYIASTDCQYFETMRLWCRRMTTLSGEIYPPDNCESELEACIQSVLLALHMNESMCTSSSSSSSSSASASPPSSFVAEHGGIGTNDQHQVCADSVAYTMPHVLKKCGLQSQSEIIPVLFAFDAILKTVGIVGGGVNGCITMAIQICRDSYGRCVDKINIEEVTNRHEFIVPTTYSTTIATEQLQMASFLITFWIGLWFQQHGDEEEDEHKESASVSMRTSPNLNTVTALPSSRMSTSEIIDMCVNSLARLPAIDIMWP